MIIFLKKQKMINSLYNLKISFIQIYLESIQDLLEPNNKEIKIREEPGIDFYFEGVQWINEDFASVYWKAFI